MTLGWTKLRDPQIDREFHYHVASGYSQWLEPEYPRPRRNLPSRTDPVSTEDPRRSRGGVVSRAHASQSTLPPSRVRPPRTIRLGATASHPRNIHVASAAVPRPISTDTPRGTSRLLAGTTTGSGATTAGSASSCRRSSATSAGTPSTRASSACRGWRASRAPRRRPSRSTRPRPRPRPRTRTRRSARARRRLRNGSGCRRCRGCRFGEGRRRPRRGMGDVSFCVCFPAPLGCSSGCTR